MAFDQLDTCKFIGDHAAELAKLAETAKMPTLVYIANMLRMQAEIDVATLEKVQQAA